MENVKKTVVRSIWASNLVKNAETPATIKKIDYSIKGDVAKKVMFVLTTENAEGWEFTDLMFAYNLPTKEDLAALEKVQAIKDIHLRAGWNNDAQRWGAVKVDEFIAVNEKGEAVKFRFNGEKDAPSEANYEVLD